MRYATIATAVVAFSFGAQAQMIELDLEALDDGLVTYDTETQLEWLDVRLTDFLSYEQAAQSRYVNELGFRHATEGEVRELFEHFGSTISATYMLENHVPIRRMVDLLGPGVVSGQAEHMAGLYLGTTPNEAGWVGLSVSLSTGIDGSGRTMIGPVNATEPYSGTGNFLVRRASPTRLLQLLRASSSTIGGSLGTTLITKATTAQSRYVAVCAGVKSYTDQVAIWRGTRLDVARADALTGNALAIGYAMGCYRR